jgi:hypothetical protein
MTLSKRIDSLEGVLRAAMMEVANLRLELEIGHEEESVKEESNMTFVSFVSVRNQIDRMIEEYNCTIAQAIEIAESFRVSVVALEKSYDDRDRASSGIIALEELKRRLGMEEE